MIAVVDYGIGNLRSAEKALQKVGADARLVSDPDEVAAADGVVLPGVGHFGRCAEALKQSGLMTAVVDALGRSVPFFGICVGFQLLFESSEEDPSATGLGIFEGVVRSLPKEMKRPQMQWNQLHRTSAGDACSMLEGLVEEPWAYFVHSFAPVPTGSSEKHVVATCDYGEPFCCAVERDLVWGTQFHPEKSSAVGLRILSNFAAAAR